MILSVSRRTDIPAFYSTWFLARLRAGFVDVPNPFNSHQVSRISLRPEDVDCIVFWTKNPAPLLPHLVELDAMGYRYYFQVTLTPYGRDAEPGLPEKAELVRTFQTLSSTIGREKAVWRYDPIFLTEKYTADWHEAAFRRLLGELASYTERCVISFLDLYCKTARNTKPLGLLPLTEECMEDIAARFSRAAEGSGLDLQSCSEAVDLDRYGIRHGSCIDKERIERVLGAAVDVRKDPTQRQECGCMQSVDVGQYNTCLHLCRYCYANFNADMARACMRNHHDDSTMLTGRLSLTAKVTERKVTHLKLGPLRGEAPAELSLF